MLAADDGMALDDVDGIGDQLIDRDIRIGDAVDEGGIGAVFQQAADEIGQQRLMRADRRIDAAGTVELVRATTSHKRFAHAMQALELVFSDMEIRTGHMEDGRERLRVVRGELREYHVGRRQELAGAGDVGDVGVDLAGEDRKAISPSSCARLISASNKAPLTRAP